MKVFETEKQIKEVYVTLESYTLCDKCNEKIKKDTYEQFKCELIHETGTNYPEGGSGEKQEMELCQKCAVELIELLKTNGYRIADSEWDW